MYICLIKIKRIYIIFWGKEEDQKARNQQPQLPPFNHINSSFFLFFFFPIFFFIFLLPTSTATFYPPKKKRFCCFRSHLSLSLFKFSPAFPRNLQVFPLKQNKTKQISVPRAETKCTRISFHLRCDSLGSELGFGSDL